MLRPLTSLRFPAAMLVFFWHASATRNAAITLSLAYAGVGFFFMLSGFILTYTYEHLFDGVQRAGSWRDFYVARFARIYPLHATVMLIALALLAVLGGEHWTGAPVLLRIQEIVAQTFLVQSWFPQPAIHSGVNGVSWSISDEAFFYAAFPLIALAFGRIFARTSTRTILVTAFAVPVVFIACLMRVHARFDEWALYFFPPTRLIDFIVGMLMGMAFLRRARRPQRVDPDVLELAAVLGVPIGLALTFLGPESVKFDATMMPFAGFAIYVFALGEGRLSRLLCAAWAVRLGEASYAFYLVHYGVVNAIERVAYFTPPIVRFAAALAVSLLCALALYTYVEAPVRQRIRTALSNLQTHAAGFRPDAAG
jgi:peptidoglycan/LPS O-acetylase OafA/YrhL